MDITKIINKHRIKLDLQATTKDEVFHELSELLYEQGVLSSVDAFVADIYQREAEGQTGLENHIAIPHGKSEAVLQTSLAIGRTAHPIPWETIDGKPVHCIILFAVRMVDKTTTHIKLMSQVASALADEEVVDRLLTEPDPDKLIALFSVHAETH
ncbi:PTS sugar transporter subunit IIA [Paenibacillus sp. WLX1005]|uniref:PTS sugar transporter subunit IIA n=1 Tax=unclassified Paenibacillus TaxID=185978 RepID=UPI003983F58C